MTIGAFVLGLSIFCLYLARKLSTRTRDPPSQWGVFYKITLSTCQVNALAVSFSFDWDSAMQGFLDAQNTLSSLGTAYFEFACFGEGNITTISPHTAIWPHYKFSEYISVNKSLL